MLFVAGNSIKCALHVSKKQILKNRIPIINYIKEFSNNEKSTYEEYLKILPLLNENSNVAIKLSSFKFNEYLINEMIYHYKLKKINIFIDAEDSINNKLYHEVSNRLILSHNDDLNLIKTYQMYRKDSFKQMENDINLFDNYRKKIGIKLVRGAYWNSERNNGELFTSKFDTDLSYNNAINFLDDIDAFKLLATHNHDSINLGMSKKSDFKFAHLLDMNTNFYNKIAGKKDVYTYIPYGPYLNMIPYLTRRLYENMDMIKYMIN